MSDDAGAPRGPIGNLLHSISQVLSTVLAMAQARLELLSSELQDEVRHAAQLLMWGFIALFAAGMSLFVGALVVIFVFWDTHRLLAACLVMIVFVIIALVAGLIVRRKMKAKAPMLSATLSELAEDGERLRQYREQR